MIETVSSTAGLLAALKTAHAGDTILLAAGTYDSAAISNMHFTTAVTIASADNSHAAVLSNLSLSNDSGLTFSHVNLSTTTGTAATVSGSQQIVFSNDVFSGSAAGSGSAMMIRSSDGVSVTGSDFGKFGVGINELSASNVSITNNTFHDITGGDIRGTIAGNETISGNTFANANKAVADHSDVVHVWGTTAANQLNVGTNTYGSTTATSGAPATGGSTSTSTPPAGHSVTVNSTAALLAALKTAHAGDTILLAAGTYDSAAISNMHFTTAVTIASADNSHAAVLSNLSLSNDSGLTFSHVNLSTTTGTAATISGSQQIVFSNDVFSGAAAGSGSAMMIRSSDGVSVTGSDFGKFGVGINELSASNVSITNNTFHDITGGDIRGTIAGNETISGNTFTNANKAVADHSDVVHVWGTTAPNQLNVGTNTYGSTTATSGAPATGGSTSTSTPPAGHSVTVNSTAALLAALKTAHAGDTILLAAGTYDSAAISNMHFTTAVTIASADNSHAAVLSNLSLSNDSGLTFSHVNLSTTTGTAATISGSQQIVFSNDVFSGAAAGSGSAMMIRSSDGVSVTGSDFGKFGVGINELSASNVSITNNTFHDITGGDIRGTIAGNETISGNTFTNANKAVADHSDVVHVWGTTAPNQLNVGTNTYGSATVTSGAPSTGGSSSQSAGGGVNSGASSPATGSTGPQTITVTNTSELTVALKTAHSGDTIKLAAGSWSNLVLNNYHFDGGAGVTITSASSSAQTAINGLTVNGSSGLNFTHLDLTQYNGSGPYIANSSNINLANDTIEGPSGSLTGGGVMIRSSTGVSVSNSVFQNLGSGIALLDNTGVSISNNSFTNINTDGIIGASSNVIVSGNSFSNFHPSAGAHPDAIQFFSDATGTSTNILIKDNVISRGSGDVIQGVFIENSSHVEISGNAMSGTMYNGISVSGTNEAIISSNYVQGYTDMLSWIITRGASADVSVVNNTTQANTNYTANGVNPNYTTSGTTFIGGAAVGDDSAMHVWLSHHAASTASLNDAFFLH